MLSELKAVLEFIDKTFPNVDYDTKEKAKAAIEQFEKKHSLSGYLTKENLDKFSQGDIVGELPFFYFDDEGNQKHFATKGIILSVSCDIDNDEHILIAPMIKLDSYEGNKDKIIHNNTLTYLYFPDKRISDYYVDFSFVNTYNKKMLLTAFGENKFKRVASLSLVGYYMFITKLSAFLARREDPDTQNERLMRI